MSTACKAATLLCQKRAALDSDAPSLVISEALSEVDSSGRAALALATQYGHPDLVATLLGLRAQVDATDRSGNTALMLAAANNEGLAVTHLLEARARLDVRNSEGQGAIELARKSAELQKKLQAAADRAAVERKMSKSCSLPSLVKASKTKSGKCRVRLDGLPVRHGGEHVEELVWEILEDCDIDRPVRVDVALDPFTLRPYGHAYVDFLNARQAEVASSALREESSLLVSLHAC